MWNWFRDNAAAIGVLCIVLGLFGGLVKFALVDPMHQRFDAIDQRFDDVGQRFDDVGQRFNDLYKYIDERFNAVDQRFDTIDERFNVVDQRFDSLTSEVSELRKLTARITERISRNEGEIDVIRQQLQTADKPAP